MIGNILIALIGILHVYILILEMFLWDKPQGLKAFGNTLEKAKLSIYRKSELFRSRGRLWELIRKNFWVTIRLKHP